jgi:hypothetical protein
MGAESKTGRQEPIEPDTTIEELMQECQSTGFVFKVALRRGTNPDIYGDEVGSLIRVHAARFEPTPDNPMKHIKYPDCIASIEAEEIVNLSLWVSDNINQNDQQTYQATINADLPAKGNTERLPMMGIITPMPQRTLATNSLFSLATGGGTFTVSPAGLQTVAELSISLNSSQMAKALNLATHFISEGFSATTDVAPQNFYTPYPGSFNYFRSSLNGIGYIMKNGFLTK